MYPNLYYVFKDWFGVDWKVLGFLNTFGFMVAMGFIAAAMAISSELKRKEKQGLLLPREEHITVGESASLIDIFLNFITGFLLGYKVVGLLFDKPEAITAQAYIFSSSGNLLAGLALGIALGGWKWWEKNKEKLKEPEQRVVRIWPHDRVGDIVVISLVFGIIGAKLFDNFENWSDFVKHPMDRILSPGGLTFYGGLIMAAIAIGVYAYRKNIRILHLADAIAPAMLIAYAVGRIGCQVAGDGDWGIYNSAYITNVENGKSVLAQPGEYERQLEKYKTYFLQGAVSDSTSSVLEYVTDRKSESLALVPNKAIVAPSFLPTWMVAYSYPQNVNKDGIRISGLGGEHDRALPVPVFPTPFYETILSTILFLGLWSVRKKIKTAGVITGIYFILNGLERFFIEKIRVNNETEFLGMQLSQAEIISFCLVLTGILMIVILEIRKSRT